VYNLLANELALLAADATQANHANALAFRLKLLVAAGLAPALGACASCGSPEHLVGYSAPAGGVVCNACEAASFPIARETHDFMTLALASALAQAPGATARALREAERAIGETLEHHAQLRLRPASAR
jgi:DNA repair protein RecO (recombination protein O)